MRADEAAPVIACTLDGQDLASRLAWIRSLTARHLLSHRLDDHAMTLVYRAEVAEELQRVVALERACCAFLTFDLAVSDAQVVLTIEAPQEAREAVRGLLSPFLPGETDAAPPSAGCGCCGGRDCA